MLFKLYKFVLSSGEVRLNFGNLLYMIFFLSKHLEVSSQLLLFGSQQMSLFLVKIKIKYAFSREKSIISDSDHTFDHFGPKHRESNQIIERIGPQLLVFCIIY